VNPRGDGGTPRSWRQCPYTGPGPPPAVWNFPLAGAPPNGAGRSCAGRSRSKRRAASKIWNSAPRMAFRASARNADHGPSSRALVHHGKRDQLQARLICPSCVSGRMEWARCSFTEPPGRPPDVRLAAQPKAEPRPCRRQNLIGSPEQKIFNHLWSKRKSHRPISVLWCWTAPCPPPPGRAHAVNAASFSSLFLITQACGQPGMGSLRGPTATMFSRPIRSSTSSGIARLSPPCTMGSWRSGGPAKNPGFPWVGRGKPRQWLACFQP